MVEAFCSVPDVPLLERTEAWFRLRTPRQVRLPTFLGSTIRGAVAMALRSSVCPRGPNAPCHTCGLHHACQYARLFEPRRDPDGHEHVGRPEDPPRPLVVIPLPPTFGIEGGTEVRFGLRWFASDERTWEDLLRAVRAAAQRGLGREAIRLEVTEIRDGSPEGRPMDGSERPTAILCDVGTPLPEKNRVVVGLRTPLRLRSDAAFQREPPFEALVRAVAFRVSALCHHQERPWEGYRDVVEALRRIEARTVEARTQWVALERYSSRQRQHLSLGGAMGEMVYEGSGLGAWLPWLRLGGWTHVGKGTVFGLGRIEAWPDSSSGSSGSGMDEVAS